MSTKGNSPGLGPSSGTNIAGTQVIKDSRISRLMAYHEGLANGDMNACR